MANSGGTLLESAEEAGAAGRPRQYRTENDNGEEETIRIISAREANQRERRVYLQQAAE